MCDYKLLSPFKFRFWAKICQKLCKMTILKKENWTKKAHLPNSTFGGLYAVYGMRAILVLQSLGIASSFSSIHVCLQASFPLQISVLSQDLPKTVQNDNFWKGEFNQKSAPSKFHIWGLYAVYGLCAILVLQSLGIASSFSTIYLGGPASFPFESWGVMSHDWPKTWKGELNHKRQTFQIPPVGFYMQYMVCVPYLVTIHSLRYAFPCLS